MIGPFRISNWLDAYANPIAACQGAKRIVAFSDRHLALRSGAEIHKPPRWISTLVGPSLARSLSFIFWSVVHRPDVVIAFHLPANGLLGLAVARLIRARAVYFCVGGIHEVLDGGIHSEQRLFAAMEKPELQIEQKLISAINEFDDVLAMGSSSKRALMQSGVTRPIRVVGVAIDTNRFTPAPQPTSPTFDVVTVARLAPIKRLERLIESVAILASRGKSISIALVGDGPEQSRLEQLASKLNVTKLVAFVGPSDWVEHWLRRARIFVLTSKSEGLPISLIEAMSCGLPAVVPSTGDVKDAIPDRSVGRVVIGQESAHFATAIEELLGLNTADYERMSRKARVSAQTHSIQNKAGLWSILLADWQADR